MFQMLISQKSANYALMYRPPIFSFSWQTLGWNLNFNTVMNTSKYTPNIFLKAIKGIPSFPLLGSPKER